jgi:hypothetical protein
METDSDNASNDEGMDVNHADGAGADGVAAKFAEIESRLCSGLDDLMTSAKDIGDVTSHHVRLHPLAACGLAFLAGIAITRMLRR